MDCLIAIFTSIVISVMETIGIIMCCRFSDKTGTSMTPIPESLIEDVIKLSEIMAEIKPMSPSESVIKWMKEVDGMVEEARPLLQPAERRSPNNNDDSQSSCDHSYHESLPSKLQREVKRLIEEGQRIKAEEPQIPKEEEMEQGTKEHEGEPNDEIPVLEASRIPKEEEVERGTWEQEVERIDDSPVIGGDQSCDEDSIEDGEYIDYLGSLDEGSGTEADYQEYLESREEGSRKTLEQATVDLPGVPDSGEGTGQRRPSELHHTAGFPDIQRQRGLPISSMPILIPTHQMAVSSRMSNHSREEELVSTLSSELNLASFAFSSGVLNQSWDAISQTMVHFKDQLSGSDLTIQFEVKELTRYNILVFVTPPVTRSALLEKTELVTSSESTISGFDFLQPSRKNLSFSINKAALSLFSSRKKEFHNLVDQIAMSANSKPFIITGHSIGGSVASLFALQLLFSLDTKRAKPPLCVTFGSPLLGDYGLHKAISDYTWDSCFLHVVSIDDCFPSLFVRPNLPAGGLTAGDTIAYHFFGRFLCCSNSGGACFDVPESVLILLRSMSAENGQNEHSFDYGSIIANLRKSLIIKDKNSLNANDTGSSRGRVSVAAQYLAGLLQFQDVGRNSQLEELLNNEMFELYKKRKALQTKAEDLNKIKVYMAQMEWYKKKSEENGIPYYDSYKNQSYKADFDVTKFKGYLQNYWTKQVKEADQMPQKAKAALRVRWLYGGTNYRRLVEPLAIADYYKLWGARDYINQGRQKHYKLLEEWFKEDIAERNMEKKNVAPPSLTEDSCFWAHVEEAIISCKILNKGEPASDEIDNLKKFEKYVLELLKKDEVSPDIFWEKSSFMKWWKDYEEILDKKLMGTSYTSPLFTIMHNFEYKKYKNGELFF